MNWRILWCLFWIPSVVLFVVLCAPLVVFISGLINRCCPGLGALCTRRRPPRQSPRLSLKALHVLLTTVVVEQPDGTIQLAKKKLNDVPIDMYAADVNPVDDVTRGSNAGDQVPKAGKHETLPVFLQKPRTISSDTASSSTEAVITIV